MKQLDEFHPVYLSPIDSAAVFEALRKSGDHELAQAIANKAKRTKADRKYSAALSLWEEGTFEVDPAPVVSSSENGAFVMVWQWVDATEIE